MEILLKDLSATKFQFIDYFFKKDNIYNTQLFDILIISIINDFGNDNIKFNYDLFNYFENYFLENEFNNYYYKLLNKIKENISKNPSKNDWFGITKYISNILIKRKKNEQYIVYMEEIISSINSEIFFQKLDYIKFFDKQIEGLKQNNIDNILYINLQNKILK